MRASGDRPRGPGLTLVEVLAVVTIVGLAAAIVLPRLPGGAELRVEAAASRLAERLSEARERAIFGGRPQRVAVDAMTAGVHVAAIEVGGMVRRGGGVELGADGDALPVRVTLAGDGGARAIVLLPAGLGRARVVREDGA